MNAATTNLDPTLTEDGETTTLRFERDLPASIERAWQAVTDVDEMQTWFPARVLGDRVVGARLTFPFDEDEADTFEGEVSEWDPPSAFAFTWHGDRLRFELTALGDDRTRLAFTQTIHHRTEAARTASGWFSCLGALDASLGGSEPDPDAWRSKYLGYLHTMGAPLGVVDGETITFERAHFVTPDVLESMFADGPIWGHDDESSAELDVEARPWGTLFTVRVAAAGATAAARWHGLLTQLDMVLASGQLVVDERWRDRIPTYSELLGDARR